VASIFAFSSIIANHKVSPFLILSTPRIGLFQ
jgi:hypothetical protein